MLINFAIGCIIGIIYCYLMYGDCGSKPLVQFNSTALGFKNGHQYIGRIRMHHWMWGIIMFMVAFFLTRWIIVGFAIILIIHGLSYRDCFEIFD